MNKGKILDLDNKKWLFSMLYGSSRSGFYSIVCKPLCISPGIPGMEFSRIFNSINRGSGNTYGQGLTIPHYYKMIFNLLKSIFKYDHISGRRRLILPFQFRF